MLSQITDFVNWIHRRNPQARTWRDYQYDLRQFATFVGDRTLDQITIHDIDGFVSHQASRHYQPTTINRRLSAIIALYAYHSIEDETLVCPVFHQRHHMREPRRLPRPVKLDDQYRFFSAITDPRDLAMFILMLRCGLRISEVAHLRMNDLYLDENHPRLITRGKGSFERSVFLSRQAERALRAYLAIRPQVPCDCVFLSYLLQGLSTTAIHKRLMRYREIAGVQLSAHCLRHTFANDLLSSGAPVTTIQKLLGHRWLETTQIYVQANDSMVEADYYAACACLEGWS